jgi:hypothetical protein
MKKTIFIAIIMILIYLAHDPYQLKPKTYFPDLRDTTVKFNNPTMDSIKMLYNIWKIK